ncbi:MAG: hypothetical protein KAW88_10335 [Candidatus Cloacimonetes bacterium]|nr:hypothetical protein [Candidatus Cloacimonadota bacterium]
MSTLEPNDEATKKATECLEEAFQCWTVVDVDEEKDIEYRKPTKKKQIEESQTLIDKAKVQNSSDEWVKDRIVELQEVVDSGKRKVWDGNRILMIAAALYAIFFFLIPGFGSFQKSETTLEYAQKHKDGLIAAKTSNISYLENRIKQLKLPAEQNPNYTEKDLKAELKKKEKNFEKATKELQELKDKSNKKVLKELNAARRKRGLSKLLTGFIFLISAIAYYFVSFVPQFVLDKRAAEKRIMAATSNFFKSIHNGISNFLINQPAGWTTRYKYSDGSTRDETTFNPAPIIGLALKIGVPIVWYLFNIMLLPIICIIKYVRNFHLYI